MRFLSFLLGLFCLVGVVQAAEQVPATASGVLVWKRTSQPDSAGVPWLTLLRNYETDLCKAGTGSSNGYPFGTNPETGYIAHNSGGGIGEYGGTSTGTIYDISCFTAVNGAWRGWVNVGTVKRVAQYTCPTGYTGPDASNMCTKVADCEMYPGSNTTPINKPDNCSCPAGTKWSPAGGCRKDCPFPVGSDANANFDLAFQNGAQTACFSGCEVQQKSGTYLKGKDGTVFVSGTYTGWACAGNGPGTINPDGPSTPDAPSVDKNKEKKPPCGSGDNVVTGSTGQVTCVPGTTPDTSKPEIEQKKKTKTFPDNSQSTEVETKTRDPNTGAVDVQTTTTCTGGQCGPAGTTSSSESTGAGVNGDGDGDEPCDPTLHFCKSPGVAGLYEKKDKTFEGPLQTFSSGIRNSVLGNSASSFFTVSIPAGACPSWSAEIPYLKKTISLSEFFCNSTAMNMMNVVGSVLMLVAAFTAFKWAIL